MAIKPLFNEAGILQEIAAGDQRAFSSLFDHYQGYVFAFGLKLTYSEALAEEIVQDIFLKIWFCREKLVEIECFGAYLNRSVRNHSFNLLRQAATEIKVNQHIGLSLTELDNSTQQDLEFRETARIIDEVINLLPAQQKLVYTLCHRDGLKYEEAAQQMNISSATVHYHMKLALTTIREHFKKNALGYPTLLLLLLSKIK